MQKYEEGLTDAQLDKKITDAGGELQPKEKPENPNLQNVIMNGYIFEIDRSVPKIVDYIGPADGIVITASIIQDNNWTNPTVTVKGTIKTYASGERITSSSASVTSGSADLSSFPSNGGDYTISNITTDTTIVITVTDSKGETKTKEIPVVIKKDTTGPTINANVTANKLKITIDATATDNESGLSSLSYSISPTTGITNSTGPLTSGTPKEITTTAEETYTVTISATDNAGNTSTKAADPITTKDSITVAEAKATINASNIKDYIGTKVDYNPTAGGTWRVFYYDATGEFGAANTLYLKRDYDSTKVISLDSYVSSGITDNGLAMMKQLNSAWKNYGSNESKTKTDTFLENEKAVAGLCDTNNWKTYAEGDIKVTTKYAIGAPSIEMWIKAYNIYVGKYEPGDSTLNCRMKDVLGYGYGLNDESITLCQNISIDTSIPQSKVIATESYQWLASPSSGNGSAVCSVSCSYVYNDTHRNGNGVCPVVAI